MCILVQAWQKYYQFTYGQDIIDSLPPSDAIDLSSIGSGTGLLPDRNKPVPELMLVSL